MKSIFKKLTLLVLVFGLVFALFGCKKNDAKALANYLLKQDKTVVSEDFVLDGTLTFGDKEYELSWESNNNAIQIEKRDNDYLAKVNYPDQEVSVTLTVKLGKATKEFTVTVLPIDVYAFSQSYAFPKDKQIVTESFDLDTTCTYKGKTATITWSVDDAYAEYIAINEEGNRCLVTPTSLNPEVKIKATFTYNGEETTKQYRMTVSQNMTDEERVDYWYSNTGVSQVISGYVVAKGNWKLYNNTYELILAVIDDSGLCGYYLYLEPTEMNEEAMNALQIGAHITNTGSVNTVFNGLHETTSYKGTTVLDSDVEIKQIVPFALDNDVIAGSPVATYMQSTLVSLTNWEVKEVKTWATNESTVAILTLTKGGVDVDVAISKYFIFADDSNKEVKLANDTTVVPAVKAVYDELQAGDFVSVKGILSNYNGKPQIIAHLADSLTKGTADTTPAAELPGTLVKALLDANTKKAPKGLVTTNTTIEFAASTDNVTVKYELIGSSEALAFDGSNLVVTPGKHENATIKVTYTCGSYSTYQLIRVESQKVSEAEMVAAELEKITNFNVDKSTDLKSKGETFADVAITWALKEASEGVTIDGSKLVVAGGLDKDVVLVATLTIGSVTETKEVTVHVTTPALSHNGTPTDPLDAKTAILMAGQLDGPSKEMSEFAYFVKGTITDDPTADYCNFHFKDGDKDIIIYGLWAANGKDRYGSKREITELPVKKGDEVALYAKLQNFNGTLELANAILLSVNGEDTGAKITLSAREAVLIAGELDPETKEKTENAYYFEVTITDDPTADYCNFHFKSGETEVLVYGLYAENGTDRYGSKREIAELPVKKGDKVVLLAKVQNFGGTLQLSGAILVSIDKPVVIEHAGTETDPFTVADAIAKTEQETEKKENAYTAAKYYVTGVVKSVKYYDLKDASGAVIGKDATIELQQGDKVLKASYTITPETLDTVYIGDTVTVYGFLQYKSGNSSVYPKDNTNAETGEWPVAISVEHGTSTVSVASDSSEHATIKELSAESGVNGTTFTFKVEAEENYVIDAVKVNGKEIEAVDGVYSAVIAGPTTISVVASEAAATEKTIEINFAQTIEGIPQDKGSRHSTSSIEVTIGGITFDLRNVYQSGYNGEIFTMLAGATTNADADGVSGDDAKQPGWIANKTPIPGRIKSITIYGRDGSSPSAVYYLDAFSAAKLEALTTSTTTVTGLTSNTLVYTAADDANLYYFNLSATTAKNGQVTKIVIVYEPGEVPQPAPTLTGIKVGGTDVTLALNAQTGLYEGTFTLNKQWARVNFVKVFSDNSEVKLMPADTTISGTGIKNTLVQNSTDTEVLFYDSGVELGDFCYSLATETKYAVTYDPKTNALTVNVATEEVPATIKGVKYGGEKNGVFELKDGKYEAVVELGAWNRIKFFAVDENDKQIALWYTNAKFEGEFTPADKTGDQWEGKLYHELSDSLRWMPPAAGAWKFVYDPATKTMTASKYVPDQPTAELTGVKVDGRATATLALNDQTGLYEGTFILDQQWSTITFKAVYSDGTEVTIKSPDFEISGTGIMNSLVENATGTEVLFFDSGVQAGYFCYSLSTATKYAVTYNPETKVLTVDVATEELPTTVKGVKYGGAKSGAFVAQQDGTYSAVVELGAWNRIKFFVVDESDNELALWYTNAKFEGEFTPADKTGDQWEGKLYHELSDSLRWMPPAAGAWKFVYDPATKTMTASVADVTAPVITINPTILAALAAKEFWEGADESATFSAFMQGITATDNVDGDIAVTLAMISLGGLNPSNLVAGDYTITITVVDEAGNQAKEEIKIHVKKYANENLLADLPTPKADYQSPNWTYEQYQSSGWKVLTSVQMRARMNGGIATTNFAVSKSTMRATYSKGSSLGVANTLSFKAANDFDGAIAMDIKLKVVDVNGKDIYLIGDANNWVSLPVQALTPYVLSFDEAEIKSVVVVAKSSADGKYLYIGDFYLTYEEPTSSPATFQVTNLQAEGNARNHIEGAGAWIWIDPTSIGLTAENMAQFTATATCESLNVVEAFFSDYSASAVRCYVVLSAAPAAEATTTINLTITHDDATYQGSVSFLGNELQ